MNSSLYLTLTLLTERFKEYKKAIQLLDGFYIKLARIPLGLQPSG